MSTLFYLCLNESKKQCYPKALLSKQKLYYADAFLLLITFIAKKTKIKNTIMATK